VASCPSGQALKSETKLGKAVFFGKYKPGARKRHG